MSLHLSKCHIVGNHMSWLICHCLAMKAQVSLCKCADSPEPSLLVYTKYGHKGRLRPKFRPLVKKLGVIILLNCVDHINNMTRII